MTPPPFSDLGKSAKDLFTKGYAHGFMKVDVTSDVAPSLQFKTSGAHDLSSQKLNGKVEVKYKLLEHGLTITEKWNTSNQLTTVAELKDKVMRGLKLTLDTSYTPHIGKRVGVLKSDWANEAFHLNGELSMFNGIYFTGSFVAQLRDNWLFGAQAKADLAEGIPGATSVSIGRKTAEYALHSFTVDGNEFGGSIYHRVHKNFEYGVQMGWKRGCDHATWAVASKYNLSQELTLRTKLDNNAQLSISAVHNLSDMLKLTLSSQFGISTSPDASNNKLGLGLEYSPPPCCGNGNGM